MQRFQQIAVAVRTLFHIEAVEAEIFARRGGRIVITHPFH